MDIKGKTMTDQMDNVLLKLYADEIGIDNLTLQELINSHRQLRATIKNTAEKRKEAVAKGYEYGKELGRDFALEHNWISREKLEKMSIIELVEMLQE
jgi:hypothetical protein